MRFRITYYGGMQGYKVSVAQYDGGDVVSIDEVEEIEEALAEARRQVTDLANELRDSAAYSAQCLEAGQEEVASVKRRLNLELQENARLREQLKMRERRDGEA